MFLRLYRITDKSGLVLLKLSAAAADWLLASGTALTGSLGGILGLVGRLFRLILSGLSALFALLLALLATIWRGLRGLGRLVGRGFAMMFGGVSRVSGSALRRGTGALRSGAQGVSQSASGAMARRSARDEIDVIIKEDPLRIQNRRLSFMVILFGIVALGAVLWATDPGRTVATPPVGAANLNNDLAANTPEPEQENAEIAAIPSPIPTATQVPEALRPRGTIAYTVRERGQTDLWAVGVGSRSPIRITNDIADERDPEWNVDGTRLAYASRQDGNWELYVYTLVTQQTDRVTFDLSFQANPTWSPDSLWIAYENYIGENLDIYALPIDGSDTPRQVTSHPAPDFSPAWSPDGRRIAFVSWRDGNQDIYIISLDDLTITNVTNTPLLNEDHPKWSPDGGAIAYSAWDQGAEKVFVKSLDDPGRPAEVISFGRTPAWSPDGTSLIYALDSTDGTQTYLSARTYRGEGDIPIEVVGLPYSATAPTWSEQTLPQSMLAGGGLEIGVSQPLFDEQEASFDGTLYYLQSLGNVQAEQPFLSDTVDESFKALRQRVLDETGQDFLRTLDDAFWTLERRPEPGEDRRSWHMTGRAVEIASSEILGFPPTLEVVREEVGVNTYWRLYIRVDEDQQSGQLGEPLRRMPWDFLAATQGDIEAFNNGGRLRREMPAGYYVDFTQLALDYGWERVPAGTDWRGNVNARNFALYLNLPENYTWCDAMLEIHAEGQIANFNCTETVSEAQ
jgi:TolB protein